MIDVARPVLQPRPLLVLAALTACALVALLALEYHSAVPREMRLSLSSSSAPVSSGPAHSASANPGGAGPAVPARAASPTPDPVRVQEWTATVLARPLFSASRRPAATAIVGPERPRLTGIVLGPAGRKAIFAGVGDSRGIVATVGGQAGAWHILAIDAGSVRVLGPEGASVLHPSRDDSTRVSDAASSGPALPEHPSILDLLRSRPMQVGIPGMGSGGLPSILRPQPPQ